MSGTVTRSAMRTRVRSAANMETSAASAFVTDTEINTWLNDALAELYDMLVQARGEDYYATEGNITVSGAAYAVASTVTQFYRLLEVMASDGAHYVKVPRLQSGDYWRANDKVLSGTTASCIEDLVYRILPTTSGELIKFFPTPNATWTLKSLYIPAFTLLTADSGAGGTVEGVNGWEEWAVLTAAIRCLIKEESDPSALMAERARIEARIKQLAPTRDEGNPRTIVDSRLDHTGDRYTALGLRDSWDW